MPASALMTVMINAARKAGRSLARNFGEVEHLQVSVKGPANFVPAADHRAETILYEELSRARHGYCFLMEERGLVEGPDKSHTWIIDPLDGTTNFLHGIPMFAISVALQREGELVAGLVPIPPPAICTRPNAAKAPSSTTRAACAWLRGPIWNRL